MAAADILITVRPYFNVRFRRRNGVEVAVIYVYALIGTQRHPTGRPTRLEYPVTTELLVRLHSLTA